MSRTASILAVFALVGLVGCKSDSQKVCAKLADLASNAKGDDEMIKKMAEEAKNTDKCAAEMDKMAKEDAAAFGKFKTCVLDEAKTLEEGMGCMLKAAMESKK